MNAREFDQYTALMGKIAAAVETHGLRGGVIELRVNVQDYGLKEAVEFIHTHFAESLRVFHARNSETNTKISTLRDLEIAIENAKSSLIPDQRDLTSQLEDLAAIAVFLKMYDAHDFLIK